MRWKTQRNVGYILFSGIALAIVLFFLVGAVPAKSKMTDMQGVDLTKPVQIIQVPAEKKDVFFDYKMLFQVLIIFGSVLAFAFLNGSRLGKIENKIDNLQELVKEARTARKQIEVDLVSAKERLTRIETQLNLVPDSSPNKIISSY